MALDELNGSFKPTLLWTVSKNRDAIAPLEDSGQYDPGFTYTLGTGVGAANEVFFKIVSLTAAGTATIDWASALTNVVGDQSIALVRAKSVLFKLLGADEEAQDGTAGTDCTGLTIGGVVTGANALFMGNATWSFNLNQGQDGSGNAVGDWLGFATGTAAGLAFTNGSSDKTLVTNNDSDSAAKLLIAGFGADS